MKSRMWLTGILACAVVIVPAYLLSASTDPATAAGSEPAAGPAETFDVDPVHSTAIFGVQHMGAGIFYGRFNDVTGTIEFNEDDQLKLDVTVAIDSIDTGNEKLNGHLKSPDFFNLDKYTKMTFKSRSAKKTGDKTYKVDGDLTILGTSKPISVELTWTGSKDGRMGKRCGFETSFKIKRSDYGVNYGVSNGALGDETKIIVSLEGVRQGGGER